MKTNKEQRDITIISEIAPQHMGSMSEVKRMVLQSKLNGADIVKLQLYSSKKLWGDDKRLYLDTTKNELKEINNFCKDNDIELSASIFDEEKLEWCEELDFQKYKIASRTIKDDISLCEKIISTNKEIIASLGMYDFEKNGVPFNKNNIKYLYCVAKYPTQLYEIDMPDFENSFFSGFSDHTVGIDACLFAISRGAKIIEKHFSNNKSLNVQTQAAHTGAMDMHDLENIRRFSDSFNLLRKNVKKK
tara:strand:+ start:1224 stop:1961 length:738 start_codon:yes stop_codon:yes gene_type:complete